MGIDLDRGVELRHSGAGIAIYMYVDTPGVWFNEHGVEVGAKAAEAAGFPVPSLLRERQKREAIAKAGAAAAASFKEVRRSVIETRGDYQVVDIGHDRYNVEFVEDGSVMNQAGPVSLSVAKAILDQLQPDEPEAKAEKEPGKPAKA